MISLDNIYLNIEANNYNDVLTFIADTLYEKGYVKETYKEALLKREENFATGLPTEPIGIAIPHSDPEHVNKPCIIIVQLKNTVKFREMGNHSNTIDAKYAFGLVFDNGEKQMPLLSSLIGMAQEEETMISLSKAETKEQILNIVKQYIPVD